jgi:flavin-dependent dehydrogenase
MGARIVVAADGRQSRLGAALGLTRYARTPKRWAFGSYFTGIDGLTTLGEMHIRANRYIGVAPLGDGLANVCVVRAAGPGFTVRDAARDGATSEHVVAEAIDDDRVLRGRFAHARRVAPVVSLGPLGCDASGAGCDGFLLAGDAAGFVDPMTGDGLRFALRGGELAAAAALAEMAAGCPAHVQLEAAMRREFASKWRLNRVIRSLVASPRGVRIATAVASRWEAPFRFLVDLAGDVPLARRAQRDAA